MSKTPKADAYLDRLKKIDAIIGNKKAEKQLWIDMATGTSSSVGGERVQTSRDLHTMERQVVEATMIDDEIEALKAEKASIIKTLERLKADQYDFLHKVYVQGMTFKEIRVAKGKSYSWATTIHRIAKERLEKLI